MFSVLKPLCLNLHLHLNLFTSGLQMQQAIEWAFDL
jgi:hypothetical protein